MEHKNATELNKLGTKPLVSIIMPCYNAAKFIDQAIRSVAAQTFEEWELLICDDNSSDASKKIAQKWSQIDASIKVLNNRYEKGASGARNTCLDVSRGRYIAFLDADDTWYPQKLEKQIDHMIKTGSVFCVSYYDVMDEDGVHSHGLQTPAKITFRHMMYNNFIPCLTAIYDREALGKVPQPNIKKRNDFALWLTLFTEKGVEWATSVPVSLASYRQNGYGLSSSRRDALVFYFICLRKYAGRAFIPALYFSSIYAIIVLIKKRFPKIYNLLSIRL